MRVKVRLIAVLAALSFAVASTIPILLAPDDSVKEMLLRAIQHPVSSLESDLQFQAWLFVVGYAIWGVSFRKTCASRRRALTLGVFAGIATAVVAPMTFVFAWDVMRSLSGGGLTTRTWSHFVRVIVSRDALLNNAIQVGGLALAGWCCGWLIHVDSPIEQRGLPTQSTSPPTNGMRPQNGASGADMTKMEVGFKGAI
jgi:hypothetical protein